MTEAPRRPERAKIYGWQAKRIAHDYVRDNSTDPSTILKIRSIKKGFDRSLYKEGWSIYGETILKVDPETVNIQHPDGRIIPRKIKVFPDQVEAFYLFIIDKNQVHSNLSNVVTY